MSFFHTHICSLANLDTGDQNNFQGSHISPVQPGQCYSQQFPCILPVVKAKHSTVSTFFLPEESAPCFRSPVEEFSGAFAHNPTCALQRASLPVPVTLNYIGKSLHQQHCSPSWLSLFSVIFMWEFVRKQLCCTLGDPVICVFSFNNPEAVLPQLLPALST